MLVENHFKKNRFKNIKIDKTNYIKDRKILGFSDEFDFSECFHSVSIDFLEFTNYFNSVKSQRFKFVKRECIRLKEQQVNLDEKYEMKIVNLDDNFNELKIKTIYSKTINKRIEKLPMLYKLKNLDNQELQFYVKEEEKKYKVCFIDIYHLAIPTKTQNTKQIFKEHVNDIVDLKELLIIQR